MGRITPSREDYLETIFDLSGEDGKVRSIDIATALGYSRASVSRAMGVLKQDGFIEQEPYGLVTLTEKGKEKAHAVRKRHDLLKYYLFHIVEVDLDTAEEDACKMEHIVSDKTLRRMEELSTAHMNEFHGGKKTE